MAKKLGVITLQGNNYGATLQATALNTILKRMGYEAENIDYNDPNRVTRGLNNKQILKNQIWINIRNLLGAKEKERKFDLFRKQYIMLSEKKWRDPKEIVRNPPIYDVYISGSDQIWNPDVINGDYNYLLQFSPDEKKKISYASSFGKGSIPKNDEAIYSELLQRYSALSVRELSGQLLIKRLTGTTSKVVLDPTLLLNRDEWSAFAANQQEKQKYVLCYYMPGDKLINSAIKRVAEHIANKENLHIINLGQKEYHKLNPFDDCRVNAGPAEFLRLFLDAEYVITNSFHGTAFAVNFSNKLCVPIRSLTNNTVTRQTRLIEFLKMIHFEDAILTVSERQFEYPVHFSSISKSSELELSRLREQSLEYLREAIER